eukprot:Skav209655  [mRNA]  locus=scaffold2126:54944:57276:+ [translate_table: standard]
MDPNRSIIIGHCGHQAHGTLSNGKRGRTRRANCTNATAAHNSKQLECSGYHQQAAAKEAGAIESSGDVCAPHALCEPGRLQLLSAQEAGTGAGRATFPPFTEIGNGLYHSKAKAQHETSSAATTADQLAESLRVQYEGLKRIECLLDVISTSGDATAMQATGRSEVGEMPELFWGIFPVHPVVERIKG